MRSITLTGLVSVFIATLAMAGSHEARAEKALTPAKQMHKAATHVITGKIETIYTKVAREGGYKVTRYLAQVRVHSDLKGGLKKDTVAYVRYWTRDWVGVGVPPPNTSGHTGIPSEGQVVTIYAVNKGYNGFGQTQDGGLDVWGSNGFQPATETAKPAR